MPLTDIPWLEPKHKGSVGGNSGRGTNMDPRRAPEPKSRPTDGKLRGSVEGDEGPVVNSKTGYRNSDEMDSGRDARHEDPVGV